MDVEGDNDQFDTIGTLGAIDWKTENGLLVMKWRRLIRKAIFSHKFQVKNQSYEVKNHSNRSMETVGSKWCQKESEQVDRKYQKYQKCSESRKETPIGCLPKERKRQQVATPGGEGKTTSSDIWWIVAILHVIQSQNVSRPSSVTF